MIRIRSRFLGLAALALSVVSLTACGTTDSTASNLAIADAGMDVTSLPNDGATSTSIRGIVTDDAAGFTISFSVKDSVGDIVTSDFAINTTAPSASATSWSIGKSSEGNTTIKALPAADKGTHTLIITAKSSSNTVSKEVKFVVTSTAVTTPLTLVASGLSIGGFDAAAGSFISVSGGAVYKTAQLTTDRSAIELIASSDANGNAILESSALAVSNQDVTDAAWGTGNATKIILVSSEPTTLEQAKLNEPTAQSALIQSAGASYVVKTVGGTYYVLTVTNVVGGGDAVTFTLKILK